MYKIFLCFWIFIILVFPIFSPLELKHEGFGPQIRILRKKSSLEPVPKVWKPMSRSQNNYF